MTQKVTVLSVHDGMARVIHNRPTACHGDCDSCAGGCGSMAAKEKIIVDAENLIGAVPGDQVMIEGQTGKVAVAVLLVYVIPVVLFFLGYFLGSMVELGACFGVLGFFLGILFAVYASRRQKKLGRQIRFQIVSYAETA